MYLTLKFKNGAWQIVRASEGIDTRQKPVGNPGVITTELAETPWPYIPFTGTPVGTAGCCTTFR